MVDWEKAEHKHYNLFFWFLDKLLKIIDKKHTRFYEDTHKHKSYWR